MTCDLLLILLAGLYLGAYRDRRRGADALIGGTCLLIGLLALWMDVVKP
jgi:hypothetical protein